MKQFLIGSFILAFLLGSAPAMAESEHRRGMLSHTSGADHDRASAKHKKFLTSRYRDDHGYRGGHKYRGHDRKGHGWRGHHGRDKDWKRGWKQEKWHHGRRKFHGDRKHWNTHRWNEHRHHRNHRNDRGGYRYHFRYNGVIGADGGPAVSGGQIMIDLSRR